MHFNEEGREGGSEVTKIRFFFFFSLGAGGGGGTDATSVSCH